MATRVTVRACFVKPAVDCLPDRECLPRARSRETPRMALPACHQNRISAARTVEIGDDALGFSTFHERPNGDDQGLAMDSLQFVHSALRSASRANAAAIRVYVACRLAAKSFVHRGSV